MAAKINPVCMPKLGMEMTEGMLAQWNIAEGDAVNRGDELFDIETEKLTNPYVAEFAGVLRRRIGAEGETYQVGQLVGVVAESDVSDDDVEAFVASFKGVGGEDGGEGADDAPAPAESAPAESSGSYLDEDDPTGSAWRRSLLESANEPASRGPAVTTPPAAPAGPVKASPAARKLARERGIELSGRSGSGRGGMILKGDVMSMSAGPAPISSAPARARGEPTPKMRRTIARRLQQSKLEAPHIYLRSEVVMTALMAARQDINDRLGRKALSVNDFLIRAAALALHDVPAANVQYSDEEMRYFDQADVSVAVALENGLVSPVIRNAGRKPLVALADEMAGIVERAKTGKLQPSDLEGGTITLSNLGMYGLHSFDAIINPPQAAILAVGAVEERPANVGGVLALAPTMHVTMSCDHRAIDGAVGAEYLRAFKALLERPVGLLI